MTPKANPFTRIVLPIAIIALGIGAAVVLVEYRPKAPRKATPETGALIEYQTLQSTNHTMNISAQGEVIPAQSIEVSPEVSGRVVWMNPSLTPGGKVKAGEALLRIDPRDYQLAVAQQRTAVEKARVEYQVEEGRQEVAKREWELLRPTLGEGGADENPLALRKPQLQAAKVAVEAAESTLQRTELALERTTIRAPFNALVQREAVDLGQHVGPQSRIATLVGADRYWAQIAVPVERLGAIQLPTDNAEGAAAVVWQQIGAKRGEWQGRLIRLLADLDPVGRMARLLIAIDDPSNISPERPLPLLLGSYVNVEIVGDELSGVYEIPRIALREGDRIFLYDEDDRLEIRPVTIVWRRENAVYVVDALKDGDRLITSRVPSPVAGMLLRAEEPPQDPQEAALSPGAVAP